MTATLQWQGYPSASRTVPEATAFAEKGFFLSPGNLFDDDVLAAAVAGHVAATAAVDQKNGGGGGGALVKVENPQHTVPAIRELLSGQNARRLGELVGALTGAEWVQIWHVQLLGKPSTSCGPTDAGCDAVTPATANVGYHQDRHYHASTFCDDSEILTAWIALSDVSDVDGPMTFVDGSHRWGLLRTNGNDFFGHNLPAQKAALLAAAPRGVCWRETQAQLRPGGVSIHDDFTIHGSGPNSHTEGRLRRSLACHLRTNRSCLRTVADAGSRASAWPILPAEEGYRSNHPSGGKGAWRWPATEGVCPVIFGVSAFEAQRAREAPITVRGRRRRQQQRAAAGPGSLSAAAATGAGGDNGSAKM
jgi:hypothetical protein